MEATAGSNTDGNMSTDEDGRGTPTPPSTTERATTPSGPAPGPSDTAGTMLPPSSPVSREQLTKRIDSLSQQNRVLKCELETYKLRVKSLQEENRHLRQASVHIQAKAEQEEEFISNTLLKKIQALKKEKENLALNYEQEEECLTNDLSRKLDQLRQEKVQLEHTLEQEQECLVNKLMRRIEKLETETTSKQTSLDNLRREKVELENTLEQEQEALVNKLWKRMDQLETEKRSLQVRLDKPVSEPESPRSGNDFNNGVPLRGVGGGMGSGAQAMPMPVAAAAVINLPPPPLAPSSQDTAANLANHIRALRQECARLKKQLEQGKQEHEKTMAAYAKEEKEIREENLRLQRRLQLEMERREALCRHLSESESSLEMEEERVYNEMSSSMHNPAAAALPPAGPAVVAHRTRTLSSPVPGPAAAAAAAAAASSRPLSPGLNYGEGPVVNKGPGAQAGSQAPHRLHHAILTPPGVVPSPSPPPPSAARRSLPAGTGSRPFPGATPPPPPPPPLMPSPVGSSAISMGERRTSAPDEAPPASPMDTSDNNGSIRPRINTQNASPNT